MTNFARFFRDLFRTPAPVRVGRVTMIASGYVHEPAPRPTHVALVCDDCGWWVPCPIELQDGAFGRCWICDGRHWTTRPLRQTEAA